MKGEDKVEREHIVEGGAAWWWPASTLLALAVAVAFAGSAGGAVAASRSSVDERGLVAVARAFNAAWNAHDVEGVVAFFAPGATIRQTGVRIVLGAFDGGPDPPLTEDTFGAGQRSLAAAQNAHVAPEWAGDEVLWAVGTPRIRAWLPWFVAAGHRIEASAYQAEWDTVTWRYRAFADPYQQVPGIDPTEGTARLVVRDGRITSFAFDTEEATVVRRRRQGEAILDTIRATAQPPRAASVRGVASADGDAPASPDAAGVGPPLALVGAAVLAGLVLAGWRRRRSAG